MTQFTSFVAVEEMVVTDGGQPRRIDVPVEVPEGMDRRGVFGEEDEVIVALPKNSVGVGRGSGSAAKRMPISRGVLTGRAVGSGGGGAGAADAGGSGKLPPPSPVSPPQAAAVRSVLIDAEPAPTPKPSAEELRRQELRTKGDAAIVSLVERLKKNGTVDTAEFRFVFDGKAEVQIWLVEKSAKTMAELKALGIEVMLDSKTSTLVIGRIPTSKLEALLDLKSVRYVAPLVKN